MPATFCHQPCSTQPGAHGEMNPRTRAVLKTIRTLGASLVPVPAGKQNTYSQAITGEQQMPAGDAGQPRRPDIASWQAHKGANVAVLLEGMAGHVATAQARHRFGHRHTSVAERLTDTEGAHMSFQLLSELDVEFARIVDDLTRRRFLGAGAGAATALGLTACGASDTGSTVSAPAETRQVPSVHGPVTITARPERVVTLDGFTMAAMLDIGVDPVGVYSAGEQYVQPQFLAAWRKIPKISDGSVGGEIDLEKVAACKPDLILGIDAQKPPYEQLTAIAPTVILAFSRSNAPWRDMADDTAAVLGRRRAFDKLERRYRARVQHIKTRYADTLARTRWDVLQGGFDNGQYWLYGPKSPIAGILADAGVRFAHGSASVKGGNQQSMSYERIDALADADAIFYYATNDGEPANLGPKLFAQPGFEALPAARAGHLFGSIYFLPSGYSDAIGALESLADALEQLQTSLG